MNLLRCQIPGFGKLAGLSLEFRTGLNLVFAANEGGKSTLQRCLTALLYGQLRADLKSQRRLDPWVEQYKPWRGDAYGGVLWCRLDSGREIEIHRSFGREDARIEIRASTGEEITREYEQQKNGDVLFARTHLGLPKDLFESIAVIRESRLTDLSSQDSIRDRITNLAQSGIEELSVRQSLDRLRELMDGIGSERAPTRPYALALEQLASLQAERDGLAARRAEYQDWVAERNRLAAEAARLEREQAGARKVLLTARLREAEVRVRTLEDLDRELGALRADIDPLRSCASFPVHELEELDQYVGASESLGKSLAEVRLRLQSAESQLRRTEEERGQLEAYSAVDGEKISDWFVQYLSLSVKRDEAQKSVGQDLEEAAALETALGKAGALLCSPEVDWQRKAREAAEEERAASEESMRLGEKIAGLKARRSRARGRRTRRTVLGASAVFLALAPGVFRLLSGAAGPALPVLLGTCVALGAVAAMLFSAAAKARLEADQVEREIRSATAGQDRLVEQGQKTQREIHQAVRESGYQTLDEFLEAAKRSEQYRQRLVDLTSRTADRQGQYEKLRADSAEVFSHIEEALAQVGLSCSPGNIKFQIDAMRSNIRRFRELDGAWNSLRKQVDAVRAEEARLAGDLAGKTARIQAILSGAEVRTPEEFRECCRKCRQVTALIEKEASRAREFQRLCDDLTLEGWRQRVKELGEALCLSRGSAAQVTADGGPAGAGPVVAAARSPFLPYMPGVEEAEEREKGIAALLSSAREEYVRAVERVNHAFQNCRSMAEIEEDVALAERKFRELSFDRDALRIALEAIQTLAREQQEVLAPQLNSCVERRFLRLCRDRYEEVRIDPEFNISVREPGSGALRAADHLSRGTQDQIYFALRFAILDLVSSQDESCPCLLDEPFAAYDRDRLAEAFRILQEEAGRRQLFVFTCREDLRDMAGACGAHVIQMTNDE